MSTTSSAKAKLWLFGDGVYVFDEHDKSNYGGYGMLGGRSWDRRREAGNWVAKDGRLMLTKSDDGTVRVWSYGMSPHNGRTVINGLLDFDRRVKAREYWNIVSYGETHGGGPSTQLNTCD